MLQNETPEDFVIATGVQHSVRQFVEWSAGEIGIELDFEGSGESEHAIISSIDGNFAPACSVGDIICRVDPRYYRPAEVETLLGNPEKAKRVLGWEPSMTAQEMCSEMVREDLLAAKRGVLLKTHGFNPQMSFE